MAAARQCCETHDAFSVEMRAWRVLHMESPKRRMQRIIHAAICSREGSKEAFGALKALS